MNDLKAFAWMVKRMRALQGRFFKTRDRRLIEECRDEERRVDRAVQEILTEGTSGLFPEEKASAEDEGTDKRPTTGDWAEPL